MEVATGTGSATFSFSCGLRGHHEYRSIWDPTVNEILSTRHESYNPHDQYAVAATKMLPSSLVELLDICQRNIEDYSLLIVHGGVVLCKRRSSKITACSGRS